MKYETNRTSGIEVGIDKPAKKRAVLTSKRMVASQRTITTGKRVKQTEGQLELFNKAYTGGYTPSQVYMIHSMRWL